METEIAYIYALLDPITDEVRYIGKTVNPKYRLQQHIHESKTINNHRGNWIKSLLREDKKPILKILKICPLSDFEKYETEYIKFYKSNNLTNSDESGQGNTGRKREIIEGAMEKISKKVYQYDIDGNFIKEYKSSREAGRSLSIDHSHIVRCCNGVNKHTNCFIFRYVLENVEPVKIPNAVKKVVIEIDKFGNEINRWKSLMDCSRSTKINNGNLSRVCNGKCGHVNGRFFKFLF